MRALKVKQPHCGLCRSLVEGEAEVQYQVHVKTPLVQCSVRTNGEDLSPVHSSSSCSARRRTTARALLIQLLRVACVYIVMSI